MKVEKDPAIEQIREIRHQISAEFGHDTKRLISHYISPSPTVSARISAFSTSCDIGYKISPSSTARGPRKGSTGSDLRFCDSMRV